MTAMELNPVTDQVRAMVQWAYSEREGVSGSIFEIFSGKETKTSKLRPSRRSAGLSATRVHAVESQKARYSKIPIASGRSGGDVRRAVSLLPPDELHWITHCYHHDGRKKQKAMEALAPIMWEKYRVKAELKGKHNRSVILYSFMVRLQLMRSTTYAGFLKWTPSRPDEFAQEVSFSSWTDTHGQHWRDIRSMFIHLDTSALMGVYNNIYQATPLTTE